jgi:catechol 2,3-dioxygenase-like lactoylglutathione lyase family enzyme
MITHFDHVAMVVTDLEKARHFFSVLGFEHVRTVVISGERMARYMSVPGIEADHCTMVLAGRTPRLEVQFLRYHHPEAIPDPNLATLREIGFNHICFAVDDLESEVQRLQAHGIALRNAIMEFHDRKIVFLAGPDGITVELAEWRA